MRNFSTFFLKASLLIFLELEAVIDALPKEHKEFYNKANSTVKNMLQKEVRSEYGRDLDKVGFSSISTFTTSGRLQKSQ